MSHPSAQTAPGPTGEHAGPGHAAAGERRKIEVDPNPHTEYPANLYDVAEIARPLDGLASVDEGAIAAFGREGYLAVNGALDSSLVADALAGLDDLIMGRRPDFRGVQFESHAADTLDSLGREARFDAVRKLMFFTHHEPRLRALSHHPAVLGLVRRLLGSEPEMFQDMALLKPPRGREKPWHQDNAYFAYASGTPVVGVWIALDRAGVENGCMHVLPGTHRRGPVNHFKRRDWQICDSEILGRRCTAVPLEPGGLMAFDGLLHHGTPSNHSTLRRRALQFHYVPVGAAKVSDEERMNVFGGEMRGAQC